jgi:hypothetical protein
MGGVTAANNGYSSLLRRFLPDIPGYLLSFVHGGKTLTLFHSNKP